MKDEAVGMSTAMLTEIGERMDDYAHMLYADGPPWQSLERAKLSKVSMLDYVKERVATIAKEAYDKGVDARSVYK